VDEKWERGTLTCADNGIGMDPDTILNRFLVLGESGKEGQGQVGGFGVAKAVILGGSHDWEVVTRRWRVTMEQIEKGLPLEELPEEIQGTVITLHFHRAEEHIAIRPGVVTEAMQLLALSDTPCTVDFTAPNEGSWVIGGLNPLEEGILIGEDETPYARWKLYQVEGLELPYTPLTRDRLPLNDLIVWRLRGLAQFIRPLWANHPHTFVVEIEPLVPPGDDRYPFTLSRMEVADELEQKVNEIIEAHRKNPVTSTTRYRARREGHRRDEIVLPGEFIRTGESASAGIGAWNDETTLVSSRATQGWSLRHSSIPEPSGERHWGQERSPVGVQVLIKGLRHTRADVLHNDKYRRLLLAWKEIITLMLKETGVRERCGIGFVFDDDDVAERYWRGSEVYYLLNPRALGLRVSSPEETLWRMYEAACHEVTHKDCDDHDEYFTSRYGKNFRACLKAFLKARPRLRRILRGAEVEPQGPGLQRKLF